MALALAFLLAVSWMVGVHHGSTWGVLCFVLSALAMRMWSRSSRGRRRIGEIQRLAGFPAKKVELYTRLEAKDLLAPDHEPLAWGACQMDWAQALKHCAAGDQDDEEVLFHLRNAEQVFDRSDYPVQWAAVQNNLGIAVLGHHPETDLADAMEQAIDFHRKALGLGGNDEAPEEKAGAYANLAATLMVRIQGSPSDNLSEAIRILEHQALPLLDPVRDRLDWSMTSALLADAYAIREDKGDLENAIRIQEGAVSALEGASRAAAQEWARGHSTPFPLASRMSTIQSYNLACKYLRRHGPGDAAKVIEECERALKELNPVEDAAVCGRVWWTQAKACEYLPDANLPENLACAERCYEQALAIWPNRENAVQLPAMQRGLGDVLFSQRRWRDARSHYAQAIGMERPLLELSSSRAGREHGLREAGDMYARAAYCLCREGAPEEALVLLDQGKAQMLRQALITAEVNLRGLPVAQQQALSAASRRVRDCVLPPA